MAKLPEPPLASDLERIGAERVILPSGSPLARLFFRGGEHPVAWDEFRFWGPGQARFDHHRGDASGRPVVGPRGILYAAGADGPGALAVCAAEIFQTTRIIDPDVRAPWFVVFRTARTLELLDLRGLWPTRAGASSAIASGPRSRARRWSQAIYDAFPDLDGLLYPSSMGGGADALALYERAQPAMPPQPEFHRSLRDPSLRSPLLAAAGAIGYGLV